MQVLYGPRKLFDSVRSLIVHTSRHAMLQVQSGSPPSQPGGQPGSGGTGGEFMAMFQQLEKVQLTDGQDGTGDTAGHAGAGNTQGQGESGDMKNKPVETPVEAGQDVSINTAYYWLLITLSSK